MAPKATKSSKEKEKTEAACKAMKKLGYSSKIVRPVLKKLLKEYDGSWKLIEDNNYHVLADVILDSQELKEKEKEYEQLNWSEDEDEENGPPLKRSKTRSCQMSQPSSQRHDFIKNGSSEAENRKAQLRAPSTSFHGKGKNCRSLSHAGFSYEKDTLDDDDWESDDSISLSLLESNGDESEPGHTTSEKRIVTYEKGNWRSSRNELRFEENALNEDMSEANPENEQLFLESEVPLAIIPPDTPNLLIQGSSNENCSYAEGNCSMLPEFIDLDADNTCTPLLLLKDASSKDNGSDTEVNHSESMNCEQPIAENGTKDMLNLDIASSSRGEVKISIMVKSSLRSQLPSVDSVLEQVEAQCLKSYGIPQTGLSMLKLMKEVCDCFLDAVNTSTCTDVEPSLVSSKNSSLLTLPAESQPCAFSKQITFCGAIKFQNLYEVSPQIPRSVRSLLFDFGHCKISVNEDIMNCSKNARCMMELNNSAPSSSRMMISPKKPSCYYINDISNGRECYPISLVNGINKLAHSTFNYIPKNVVFQNANVNFRLAQISEQNCCSNCFGDCLSLKIPCACAGETGGQFAYTPEGLVNEKFLENCISVNLSGKWPNLFYCQDCPILRSNAKSYRSCKGHVTRKFIKECWYKCGCSMECGNRVVQRGITAKLQVFMTPEGKGWGLRTLEDLPKGAFICEYVGEVLTNGESAIRNSQNTRDQQRYSLLLDANWSSEGVLKDEEALCLDATSFGNVARFINHRCHDANMVEIPIQVETPNRHYYHLALFTTRKVNALEELTWDYGIDFKDQNHSVRAFHCLCASEFCRDREKSIKRKRSVRRHRDTQI